MNQSTFSDLALSGITGVNIHQGNLTTSNLFNGVFLVDTTSSKCTVSANTSSPGLTNTCTNSAGVGGDMLASSATLVTGLNQASSFKGMVTSDSSNTQEDALGQKAYNSFSDWLNFESLFRGWGIYAHVNLENSANQLHCAAGNTCQIYDWRLKLSDAQIRNRRGTGSSQNSSNDGLGNYLFPLTGNDCPTEVDASIASNILATQPSCSVTVVTANPAYDTDGECTAAGGFWGNNNTSCIVRTQAFCTTAGGTWKASQNHLKNASEIMFDNIGDDDGLCESNETCLYNPNFGAYQGHGTLLGCDETYGSITGFTILGYESNGI